MQAQFQKIGIDFFSINIPHIICRTHNAFVCRLLHIEDALIDGETNHQLAALYNLVIALIN